MDIGWTGSMRSQGTRTVCETHGLVDLYREFLKVVVNYDLVLLHVCFMLHHGRRVITIHFRQIR